MDVSLSTQWNTDKASVLNITNRATQIATFFGIKPKHARMPTLGSRELEVMELFWSTDKDNLSVQQALDLLLQKQGECIGLNTMQSTLERLYRKELLLREKQGRAFIYRTACAKKEVIQRLFHDIATDMTDGNMLPMISGFMEYIATQDPELSTRLASALRPTQASRVTSDTGTKVK
jgi:predicted transcriptional regulator